jgi:hypothetical protein
MTDHRIPPPFKKGDNYENWKKTIKIWQAVTPLKKEKQGAAMFLSLDTEAKEAVLELPERLIAGENGLTHVLEKLDSLYQRDKTQLAFEALEEFESTKRKENQTITDFCNQFELSYNKAKVYGTSLSTDVLAFRLLKAANLKEEQEELVKATVGELKYDNMKEKIKRINMGPGHSETAIKQESVFLADEEDYFDEEQEDEEVYFTGQKTRQNVSDEFGRPTRCSFCQSIYHYIRECPHAINAQGKQRGGSVGHRGSFVPRGASSYSGGGRYTRGRSRGKYQL